MRTVLVLVGLLSWPVAASAQGEVVWRLGETTSIVPRPFPFRWIADEQRITLISTEGEVEGTIDLRQVLPGEHVSRVSGNSRGSRFAVWSSDSLARFSYPDSAHVRVRMLDRDGRILWRDPGHPDVFFNDASEHDLRILRGGTPSFLRCRPDRPVIRDGSGDRVGVLPEDVYYTGRLLADGVLTWSFPSGPCESATFLDPSVYPDGIITRWRFTGEPVWTFRAREESCPHQVVFTSGGWTVIRTDEAVDDTLDAPHDHLSWKKPYTTRLTILDPDGEVGSLGVRDRGQIELLPGSGPASVWVVDWRRWRSGIPSRVSVLDLRSRAEREFCRLDPGDWPHEIRWATPGETVILGYLQRLGQEWRLVDGTGSTRRRWVVRSRPGSDLLRRSLSGYLLMLPSAVENGVALAPHVVELE